jgi:hypothetical protein
MLVSQLYSTSYTVYHALDYLGITSRPFPNISPVCLCSYYTPFLFALLATCIIITLYYLNSLCIPFFYLIAL